MRIAGKLAAEVLDFIGPRIKPGITTAEVDRCYATIIWSSSKATIPAPLNYAPPGYTPYPKSICTSSQSRHLPRRAK